MPAPAKSAGEVSFMTYNAENLFDTQHDPGKEDYTYMPQAAKDTQEVENFCMKEDSSFRRRDCFETNWDEAALAKKLDNIKRSILQVDNGKGPDILVLVEVENDKVLTKLNKDFLKDSGYQTQVLIEGNDPRGIDPALLSKFPMEGKPVLHQIPFQSQDPNEQGKEQILRGILEVTLRLPDKSKLTVFANHFPSQGNPRHWRAQYVNYLAKLISEKSKINPVIAAGDLNITAEEEKEVGFFSKNLSDVALVSHLIGCKECEGTHYYRGGWSFLDAIMFSKDLGPNGNAGWRVIPESIAVPRSVAMLLNDDGTPKRWDYEAREGASDHLPLYVRLAPRSKVALDKSPAKPAKTRKK
jgi:endonuclease/exonuclease/phosphatase family metal-dependent hydrolase